MVNLIKQKTINFHMNRKESRKIDQKQNYTKLIINCQIE